MAEQKKNIARLIIQGIGILGILSGLSCFLCGISLIFFAFGRENLTDLFLSLIPSGWALVLGAFLVYPSYQMLRGKSFTVIKTIAAFLALTSFSLIILFAEDLKTSELWETSTVTEAMIDFFSFLLLVFVSVLVYKICFKLLERLLEAAYGPQKISEPQNSTDKQ